MPKASDGVKDAFRGLVPTAPGVTIRPMFGHLAAFVNGNMFTGTFGDRLFVRAAGADRDTILASGGEDFAPMAGRPMTGYVCLSDQWRSDSKGTRAQMELALEKTSALPPKQPKERKAAKR